MIPRIKKILYATDLTKNSAYAFRYAVNSAQKHEAEIHIFHVIETMSSQTQGLLSLYMGPDKIEKLHNETKQSLPKRIEDRIKEFARRELQKDPETLKRVASVQVVMGDPAEEILKKMDELKADILILGMHGRDIIKHTFLGRVSERVLHRIRKPVFIIPLPEEETDITLGEI
ncbi:MAG: universal stress protein [Deltaproteobacteria bacterium]|nr:universal stress protein [Deltaproteobacteria bacterium]